MSVVCEFVNQHLDFFSRFPGSHSQGEFRGQPYEFHSDAVVSMEDHGKGRFDFVVLRFELSESCEGKIEANLAVIFDAHCETNPSKFYIPMPKGRSVQVLVQEHLRSLYLIENYKGEVAKMTEWVDFLRSHSDESIVFGRAFHRQVQH